MADTITEKDKWVISIIASLLFIIVASPVMYRLSGGIFNILGIKIQQNGCPNIIGLLIHAAVFAILVRLSMLIPIKPRENFSGLANPAGMKEYNTAYLVASDDSSCGDCVTAAQTCMENPFDNNCQNSIQKCVNTCKNKNVIETIKKAQLLSPVVDYSPKGSCPYVRTSIYEDPNIIM